MSGAGQGILRVPKLVAVVKICGNAVAFKIYDTMDYELPTEEQRENLKKTFGIEIKVVDDG